MLLLHAVHFGSKNACKNIIKTINRPIQLMGNQRSIPAATAFTGTKNKQKQQYMRPCFFSSSTSSSRKKEELIERLLQIKEESKLTYDDIAKQLQVTNVYAAQLFVNQAQLKSEEQAEQLKRILPKISQNDLLLMQKYPTRSFDPNIMQEPLVYRLVEAMQHYGLSIKNIVNEKKGDGIISAIDLYVTLDVVQGTQSEDRFVLTLNGKFLPHVEQLTKNNTAIINTTSTTTTP